MPRRRARSSTMVHRRQADGLAVDRWLPVACTAVPLARASGAARARRTAARDRPCSGRRTADLGNRRHRGDHSGDDDPAGCVRRRRCTRSREREHAGRCAARRPAARSAGRSTAGAPPPSRPGSVPMLAESDEAASSASAFAGIRRCPQHSVRRRRHGHRWAVVHDGSDLRLRLPLHRGCGRRTGRHSRARTAGAISSSGRFAVPRRRCSGCLASPSARQPARRPSPGAALTATRRRPLQRRVDVPPTARHLPSHGRSACRASRRRRSLRGHVGAGRLGRGRSITGAESVPDGAEPDRARLAMSSDGFALHDRAGRGAPRPTRLGGGAVEAGSSGVSDRSVIRRAGRVARSRRAAAASVGRKGGRDTDTWGTRCPVRRARATLDRVVDETRNGLAEFSADERTGRLTSLLDQRRSPAPPAHGQAPCPGRTAREEPSGEARRLTDRRRLRGIRRMHVVPVCVDARRRSGLAAATSGPLRPHAAPAPRTRRRRPRSCPPGRARRRGGPSSRATRAPIRVGSEATNAGRNAAGAASETCRCSGGRNAQPAGGTVRHRAASVAARRGAASGACSSERCHGHRMRQRPSLSRVLIAAISCT